MKRFINLIILSFLTGCIFPGSSCGFDWNCNTDISDTNWYKKISACIDQQQSVAREYLKLKYNKEVDSDIYSKCIKKNGRYKFETDPQYIH